MNDKIDININELRMVILELCKQAAASGDSPTHMVDLIERIGELTAWYKAEARPPPN